MNIDFNTYDDIERNIPYDFFDHEDFYDFLIENNVFYDFVKCFYTTDRQWKIDNFSTIGYNIGEEYTIKMFLDNITKWRYIVSAFRWTDDCKGYEFWSSISYKWEKIVLGYE